MSPDADSRAENCAPARELADAQTSPVVLRTPIGSYTGANREQATGRATLKSTVIAPHRDDAIAVPELLHVRRVTQKSATIDRLPQTRTMAYKPLLAAIRRPATLTEIQNPHAHSLGG